MMMRRHLALFLLSATTVSAFVVTTPTSSSRPALTFSSRQTTELQASNTPTSRREFLTSGLMNGGAVLATLLTGLPAFAAGDSFTTPNGVDVTKTKVGSGPAPDLGELAAIRFKANYGEMKIDDIFDSPEPYYTRVGSGGMIKGVEEVLPMMKVGDRWTLTIPSQLAFGPKGRPASAGKPRIPSDATIVFEVEMVGLPGKEPELIELIGDV